LKGRNFAQQDSVRYGVRCEEGRRQVVGISSFSTMRAENESIFATLSDGDL
jgi:hypothetical protein